jgi:hypothetical protein
MKLHLSTENAVYQSSYSPSQSTMRPPVVWRQVNTVTVCADSTRPYVVRQTDVFVGNGPEIGPLPTCRI